jgi:zinc transporter ZupT
LVLILYQLGFFLLLILNTVVGHSHGPPPGAEGHDHGHKHGHDHSHKEHANANEEHPMKIIAEEGSNAMNASVTESIKRNQVNSTCGKKICLHSATTNPEKSERPDEWQMEGGNEINVKPAETNMKLVKDLDTIEDDGHKGHDHIICEEKHSKDHPHMKNKQHSHSHSHEDGDATLNIAKGSLYAFAAAIIAHSFVDGLQIGFFKNVNQITILATSIMLHKVPEAFIIGFTFAKSSMKLKNCITLLIFIVYIISAALGLLIGAIVSENTHEFAILVVKALSAGTFIYLAIVDLMVHEFQESTIDMTPCIKFFKLFFLILGWIFIILLVILIPEGEE